MYLGDEAVSAVSQGFFGYMLPENFLHDPQFEDTIGDESLGS